MGSFAMMNLANASLDNISEIHNLPDESVKQGSRPFTDMQSDVRFDNVSFSYDGKRKAVNHISFSAKQEPLPHWLAPLEVENPLC